MPTSSFYAHKCLWDPQNMQKEFTSYSMAPRVAFSLYNSEIIHLQLSPQILCILYQKVSAYDSQETFQRQKLVPLQAACKVKMANIIQEISEENAYWLSSQQSIHIPL